MLTFTGRVLHQLARGYFTPPTVSADKAVKLTFRCYPIDIDTFFHMNNAKYLLNAELSRWRTLPATSIISRLTSKKGMLFLAAENNVQYFRPIKPMQRYIISTTCFIDKEDKWFYYTHTFQEHPDDVDQEARTFAVVKLKAVVKQRDGKTIKPSVLMEESEFYKNWVRMI